jgi:hypothetical protein
MAGTALTAFPHRATSSTSATTGFHERGDEMAGGPIAREEVQ